MMRRSPLPLVASLPPAPPSTPRLGLHPSASPSPLSISSLSRGDRRLLCRDRSAASLPHGSPRCAEVAGGAAAGCAALCCCCPCGIVSLVFLAVVGLPAGLCRRAIRRRRLLRRRSAGAALLRRKAAGEEAAAVGGAGAMGLAGAAAVLVAGGRAAAVAAAEVMPSEEMREMEKEMWDLFYGTGFWRSPSQREY